jgi:SAM-dependent methyltransferase
VAAARGIRARFWNADGCPCPAADGSYDVVIAADIIEHLIDTDMFMSEMHRIIAPGGSLIVSTPNLASWYNRVRLIRGLVPVGFPGVSATSRRDLLVDNNHLRVNVVGEWTNLFQRAGFEVREIRGCAAYFEAWQGGARVAALRALGRFVERVPSLADVLVFILKR